MCTGGTRQYEAVKELLPKQKESDVEKSHLTPLECAIHHLSSTFDPDMLPCRCVSFLLEKEQVMKMFKTAHLDSYCCLQRI